MPSLTANGMGQYAPSPPTRMEPVASAKQPQSSCQYTHKGRPPWNLGGERIESLVLKSWTVSPEHPQHTIGRGRGRKPTAMPTPVQKNYTIYIYIYIQYINLFLLSPNNAPPPNNLKVVSSRSKNLTIRERIKSFFPFLFPLGIRYWLFTNETRNKTRKEELLKVQTWWAPLMLHGMWLAAGRAEG